MAASASNNNESWAIFEKPPTTEQASKDIYTMRSPKGKRKKILCIILI